MSVLILNKEKGISSFNALKEAQKELSFKKAGHAGTLDPMATGVLPIFFDGYTKLINLISNDKKEYIADFVLGISSNTQDITGELTFHSDSKEPKITEIKKAITEFIGKNTQIVPEFSAKKINGNPMYKLARKGKETKKIKQEIRIYKIELLSYKFPKFKIKVLCSKGTYVRTLGVDIAKKLNTHAAMSELVRTKFGSLSLEDSVTLSKLKNLDNHKKMQYVKRIEEILINVPKVKIKSSEVKKFQNGSHLESQKIKRIGKYLVFHEDNFLGLGEIDKTHRIKPKKVFSNRR
tara:strand:- start:292 stop:1167 length:876 start_codon:yes stop_codon:yes gene_type:complete